MQSGISAKIMENVAVYLAQHSRIPRFQLTNNTHKLVKIEILQISKII